MKTLALSYCVIAYGKGFKLCLACSMAEGPLRRGDFLWEVNPLSPVIIIQSLLTGLHTFH